MKITWSRIESGQQAGLQLGRVREVILFHLNRDNDDEVWILVPQLPGVHYAIPFRSEEEAKQAAPRILDKWLNYLKGIGADFRWTDSVYRRNRGGNFSGGKNI